MENKRLAQSGADPLAEKRRAKAKTANRLTFAEAAERTCAELTPTWKSTKEPKAFLSSLRTHAFPYFGEEYVGDVTSGQIRQDEPLIGRDQTAQNIDFFNSIRTKPPFHIGDV